MVPVNFPDTSRASGRLAAVIDGARRLEGLPVAVVPADGPGAPAVFANEAFTRATGLTLSDLKSRTVLEAGAGSEVIADLRRAVREQRSTTALLPVPRAGGGTFWARMLLTPLTDRGVLTHWLVVLVDLSAEIARQDLLEAEAEGARRQNAALGLVARVSDLMMDVEDPDGLRDIAELLSREVVRWASFYLDDDGLHQADGVGLRSAAARRSAHPGPSSSRPRRFRGSGDDPVQLLLAGAGRDQSDLDLTGAPEGTASAWLAQDVRERLTAAGLHDVEGVLVLRVPGRHRVLGLLVVVLSPADERRAQDRRTVLDLIVRRVGLAAENVRLYAREHRMAETLQRAMLPEQAEIDGLDVWSYYAPNVVYAQVGGDWYDVMQIDADTVGVVIGDVVGHDVEAAAAMGQLRSVVRAYAIEVTDPGPALERVDTLVAGMRIPRSAGLVLTTLTRTRPEPVADAGDAGPVWRLAYCRAGHLPALLVRDGKVRALDEAGGSLIGFGRTPRTTAHGDLLAGDVLIFYTDGLVERRDRALPEGLAALHRVAAGATAVDAAGIGEELLSRLAGSPEDDVAVVVVRVPDRTDRPAWAGGIRARRWQLPNEPASIGRARHAVLRTCRAWEAGDPADAELVVSELVANAVLHGWGPLSLRLHDTGDGLRIEVGDSNPTPPSATDGHAGRIGGFGMRIVERLADWGWRPAGAGKVVWARVRPGSPRDRTDT